MFTVPEQSVFGLDIGQTKLRLVQIQTRRRYKILTAHRTLNVPPGIIIDGEVADPKHLTQLVSSIYHGQNRRDRPGGNGVISVLPETKTFMKLITIPTIDPAQIDAQLQAEIPRHIPLPLEEIYYDWQMVETAKRDHCHIIIGVAPRHIVDTYLSVLQNAGLVPFALEIEAAPITRSLLRDEERKGQGDQIVIDMGAARTGLIVVLDGIIQLTVSLPISGMRITKTIAETLKISDPEAEEAKLVCGLDSDRCQGALKRVLYATLDDLCRKIENAIAFYGEKFTDHQPISEIILTGGGSNFIKIDTILTERFRIS